MGLTELSDDIYACFTFAWRFICHPREVGTPFACSSAVAEKILSLVPPRSDQAHYYLEVGPGTGAFTGRLIERMGPNDRLDLVEIDKVFCDCLQKQYGSDPRVHVLHMPIQDWAPAYQYDAVIAAVPLNGLPSAEILRPVLDSYVRLAKPEAPLSAVEYIGTSTLKNLFLFGERKKLFQEVIALKTEFFAKYSFATEKVWKNLPPARVMHCRFVNF